MTTDDMRPLKARVPDPARLNVFQLRDDDAQGYGDAMPVLAMAVAGPAVARARAALQAADAFEATHPIGGSER